MQKNKRVAALIVAAGQGKRFGGAVSKQFLEVCGRPLLWYSLAAFERCAAVDEILVILSSDSIAERTAEIAGWGFDKFSAAVAGGAERHDSVFAGLEALSPEVGYVAIHDGVRPMISPEIIGASIDAALTCGAAIVGVPPKDTIKRTAGGLIEETLDRSRLLLVQTPQVFRVDLIRAAYERAYELGVFSTDDAALVEAIGQPVCVVTGDYRNIKVTSPEDLLFVNALLEP